MANLSARRRFADQVAHAPNRTTRSVKSHHLRHALGGRAAGPVQHSGKQAGDLVDGQRDDAVVGWVRLAGPTGSGAVPGLGMAAVMAQMAAAAMTSTVRRAVAV